VTDPTGSAVRPVRAGSWPASTAASASTSPATWIRVRVSPSAPTPIPAATRGASWPRNAQDVGLADLASEPFVDFPYGTAGRAQTDRAFARSGLSRDVAFEVTDAPLMAQVIRHGLAIGFLPSTYLQRAPELSGLATATVTDAPTRVEYVVWGKPGPTPATRAFLAAMGVTVKG